MNVWQELKYMKQNWRMSLAYIILAVGLVAAFYTEHQHTEEQRDELCLSVNNIITTIEGLINLQGPPPAIPPDADDALREVIEESYERQRVYRGKALSLLEVSKCERA